jgi:hypothetical protein
VLGEAFPLESVLHGGAIEIENRGKAVRAPCFVSRSARTAAMCVGIPRPDGAPFINPGLSQDLPSLEVSLRTKMSDNLLLTC